MAQEDQKLISVWAREIGSPMIDAGCGPGHWTKLLHDHGVAVEGIDMVSELAFTVVLDAVRTAPGPHRILPDKFTWTGFTWTGADGEAHPVIPGIEQWIARAGREHKTFAELGAPFALASSSGNHQAGTAS